MAELVLDTIRTHRLGVRAFLLFLSRQIRLPLAGVIFFGVLWYYRNLAFGNYAYNRDYILQGALVLVGGLLIFKMVRAFMEYRGYAYRFDEEFFHITRGYINRQEIGVVYHQIQTVTIKHDILDRVLGVGHLVIILNGQGGSRQPEVVLPALDHNKAQLVQKEILRKARMHAPRYAPPEGVVN